jgi:hypothetical protein
MCRYPLARRTGDSLGPMGIGDRLRRLDNNPVSGGIAWTATHISAPIGVFGGLLMVVLGLVQLADGGDDAAGLLGMGIAWLVVGLILLPPSMWRRVRRRR